MNRSGICGPLHLADPLDACSSLRKSFGFEAEADQPRFALIERGNCPFEVKVKHAQAAGFQAAIVYDDADHRNLVSSKSLQFQSRLLLIAICYLSV